MALHLANIVNSWMGPNAWITMHAYFEDYEDGRVLVVHCERARSAVYVTDGATQHFYVRTGPSTTELNLSQMQEYVRQRFHGSIVCSQTFAMSPENRMWSPEGVEGFSSGADLNSSFALSTGQRVSATPLSSYPDFRWHNGGGRDTRGISVCARCR